MSQIKIREKICFDSNALSTEDAEARWTGNNAMDLNRQQQFKLEKKEAKKAENFSIQKIYTRDPTSGEDRVKSGWGLRLRRRRKTGC
jgi:hypothetical protein